MRGRETDPSPCALAHPAPFRPSAAGLALAARLSETASNTVLVLEAGTHQPTNTGILIPGEAGTTFGTDVDWAFYTVPQTNANDRKVSHPRGKVVGGTSALNFMAWTRGYAPEYDAWASLSGSDAWTFDALLPYFEKSEAFTKPGANNVDVERESDASVHGAQGPVSASYTPYISPQFVGFYDGLSELDVPEAGDMCGGNNTGRSWSASTVEPATETRSTSDTAYSERRWFVPPT